MSLNGEVLKNAELVFGLVAPIGTDANKVAEKPRFSASGIWI